eukprot:3266274-Alexandrium_andersonii.AAC.1
MRKAAVAAAFAESRCKKAYEREEPRVRDPLHPRASRGAAAADQGGRCSMTRTPSTDRTE